jgi:alpha-beta hydrolase superfamily lysophospholipase
MRVFEDWVVTAQRQKLFVRGWTPEGAKASVFLTHGQAEHSGCYGRLVQCLTKAGYAVWAWDLRGHGKSDGKRGYVAGFGDYVTDFVQTFKFVKSQMPSDQSVFMISHSMGGLIQTRALIENTDLQFQAKAQVLSSPLFGLAVKVPLLKEKAARVLAKVAPKITMFNEINYSVLSHDPEMMSEYKNDPLRHDQVSPTVYMGMLESFEILGKGASKIRMPTLLQQAGADQVVSRSAAERVYAQFGSTDKEVRIYEGLFHEIYNETARDRVFNDLLAFLAPRI